MKRTSYPKEDIKVLLLEGVSRSALDIFRQAGYSQIEFHEKSLRSTVIFGYLSWNLLMLLWTVSTL